MGEYEDHPCPDCGDGLVQLSGDWLCPECDEIDSIAGGQDHDFIV